MKNVQRYKQITLSERVEIYALVQQGIALQEIARRMERNVGTISRELKRNRSRFTKRYEPVRAQEISTKRQKEQRTKAPLKNVEIFVYVREKLRGGWSPEVIAGRVPIDLPGHTIVAETIYQYIYGKGKRYKLWQHLPNRHRKRQRLSGRGVQKERRESKIPAAVSIDLRPTKANNRTQAGHLETDLMEGARGTKTALSVTVERKARYTLLGKVRDKTAKSKQKVLTRQLKTLQSVQKSTHPIVRSVTADNGSENTRHLALTRDTGADCFFCHPYHSWEKGTVEWMIKRVRQYLPKGTCLLQVSDAQIQWLENRLNNTPLKCLNYLTPNEVMEQEVNTYKFRRLKKQKEATVALHLRI